MYTLQQQTLTLISQNFYVKLSKTVLSK